MPIYEYQCHTCGDVTSVLIMKTADQTPISCKTCQGEKMVKVVSCFAVHETEHQRLQKTNTSRLPDDSHYNDPRNVGLWAKKRAKELGAALGPEVDEAIEKARSGKIKNEW